MNQDQQLREALEQLERAAHRKGELWERCQGKGWPDIEADEFFKLRDKTIPALRAALLQASTQRGEIVVTKNEAGQIVAVTRQDEEGRILEVIAEASVQREQPAKQEKEQTITMHLGDEITLRRSAGWDSQRVVWHAEQPAASKSCIACGNEIGHAENCARVRWGIEAIANKDAALKAERDRLDFMAQTQSHIEWSLSGDCCRVVPINGFSHWFDTPRDAIDAAITQGQEALK